MAVNVTGRMAIVISNTVNFERPLLGNVIAVTKANIDKSLLENWLNVADLQATFPGRISLEGSKVSFEGPVAIIQSATLFKVQLAFGIAGLFTFLTYQAGNRMRPLIRVLGFKPNEEQLSKISLVIAGVIGLAAGALCYRSLGRTITPGVHFFNLPKF